jgi:hypothetical protein
VKVTLDIYAQAQMPAKRAAQQKVVEMVRPEARQKALSLGGLTGPQTGPRRLGRFTGYQHRIVPGGQSVNSLGR